ncbi:MAG: hypothetical protein QNJ46_29550, partial [Leptolyngbyaceae cyanobacterium MO_188.B28]|nr:hypothetical protein [Leptolyngbyaceae cyanobacterium MO_188.B28]
PPHSPSTSAAPTATVRPIPQAVKPNEPVPPPSTVTNPTTPNPAHIHCDAYEACAPNLTPPR